MLTTIGPSGQLPPEEIARRVAELGYFPLPCIGKAPIGIGWSRRVDPFELPFEPDHNIGILCGRTTLGAEGAYYVVGIDVDIDDSRLVELIGDAWSLLGAPARIGRAPRRMFLCRTREPAKSIDLSYEGNGHSFKIQIIGKGRQFIAFGTHPDTGLPYHWPGLSPISLGVDYLPLVDVDKLIGEFDAILTAEGIKRRVVAERKIGAGGAGVPADVSLDEWAALARWGASESARAIAELRAMAPRTGRGGEAYELGLRLGPLVTDGLLSREMLEAEIFDATSDWNASFHSFGRGVEASEGEAVRREIETLRRPALMFAAAGIETSGTAGSEGEKDGRLIEALRDRAATLGAMRKSKASTAARTAFARLCSALERRGAIGELESFEVGLLARSFDQKQITEGKNPFAPAPKDMELASAVLQGLERGDDLLATLALGEAVLRPPVMVADGLPTIEGGTHPAGDDLFEALSARFAGVNRDGSIFYVHRTLEGRDQRLSAKDLLEIMPNVFASNGENKELALAWWKKHPNYRLKNAVFNPRGEIGDDEYNFWRGFGVERRTGRNLMAPFIRHLWRVVCRRDRAKFKYLWRWLAWAVQRPDENPETVIVLKGGAEGSGKSTVSEAMRRIFDAHAVVISSPEQLLGDHNEDLEFASFVMIEEALFAGDPRQTSAMRSKITSRTMRINPKFIRAYQAPNMMHAILTTNHDWAIHAGEQARRWFVCEVSDERVGDKGYWDRLYGGLEAGGYGQLLDALLETDLEGWSPRAIVRTGELREQQELSADSVVQWLRAAAEDGGVEYLSDAGTRSTLELGRSWHTATLYRAYTGSLRASGARRPMSRVEFGKRMRAVLGAALFGKHVVEVPGGKESRGYCMPEAEALEELLRK